MAKKITKTRLLKENEHLREALFTNITQFEHVRSSEQTVACPICSEPYVFYMYLVGDQSACMDCKIKARKTFRLSPKAFQWH